MEGREGRGSHSTAQTVSKVVPHCLFKSEQARGGNGFKDYTPLHPQSKGRTSPRSRREADNT